MAAPDFTDQYNTKLDPKDEESFMSWLKKNEKQRDLADYDLRGAWLKGLLKGDERGHLPDTFKKPNHPTFSSESMYSTDQTPGGDWVEQDGKWIYKPSQINLQFHGAMGLQDYFKQVEPDATLLLPEMAY